MASFGYQLREILATAPEKVLEIGIGTGFVAHVLRDAGLAVTTLDLDGALDPDVVGDVTALPFGASSFDVVGCFEVLEHIPWALFPAALREIHRVCRRSAIISLPDARRAFRVHIPILVRQKVVKLPQFCREEHEFDGEHYWEINKKGFALRAIMSSILRAGFHIEVTYRPWEAKQHRFFRLRKEARADSSDWRLSA